jgi:hypothetical protein
MLDTQCITGKIFINYRRDDSRNACEPSNLFGSHRQLDRLAPSCHDVTPRLIKHKRVTGFHDCLFHRIGRLVFSAGLGGA